MKKSWIKIGFILWDVLRVLLQIFKMENKFTAGSAKHVHLKVWIADVCRKRGWRFNSHQIDNAIKGAITVLKEVLKKGK